MIFIPWLAVAAHGPHEALSGLVLYYRPQICTRVINFSALHTDTTVVHNARRVGLELIAHRMNFFTFCKLESSTQVDVSVPN